MNETRLTLDRALNPNRAEPTEVSRETRDRLVRLAYRFLWNRDDAEDAVQDALAASQARRGELRETQRWWPWVCRILIHRCHEQGRKALRKKKHTAIYAGKAEIQAADSDAICRSESSALLQRMVVELPRRQREVIVLRYLQRMGYEEIANVLGLAPATARVHAQAGLETIRTRLLDQHSDWFGAE